MRDSNIVPLAVICSSFLIVGIGIGTFITGTAPDVRQDIEEIKAEVAIDAEAHVECIVIEGISGDSIRMQLQRERKYDIKISGAEDSSIELTFDKDEEDK